MKLLQRLVYAAIGSLALLLVMSVVQGDKAFASTCGISGPHSAPASLTVYAQDVAGNRINGVYFDLTEDHGAKSIWNETYNGNSVVNSISSGRFGATGYNCGEDGTVQFARGWQGGNSWVVACTQWPNGKQGGFSNGQASSFTITNANDPAGFGPGYWLYPAGFTVTNGGNTQVSMTWIDNTPPPATPLGTVHVTKHFLDQYGKPASDANVAGARVDLFLNTGPWTSGTSNPLDWTVWSGSGYAVNITVPRGYHMYAGPFGNASTSVGVRVPDNGTVDVDFYLEADNMPPLASIDRADCSAVSGWTFDRNAPNKALNIQAYWDGPAGSGKGINAGVTTIPRPDLNVAYPSFNLSGNHGFSIPVPNGKNNPLNLNLLDNNTHTVYLYASDLVNGSSSVGSSPVTLIGSATFGACVPMIAVGGYKVDSAAAPFANGTGTLVLDAGAGSSTASPYGFTAVGTDHTVTAPDKITVGTVEYTLEGYTLCYVNGPACHARSFIQGGNSAAIKVPIGTASPYTPGQVYGTAYLWWHYKSTRGPFLTTTSGDIHAGGGIGQCTGSVGNIKGINAGSSADGVISAINAISGFNSLINSEFGLTGQYNRVCRPDLATRLKVGGDYYTQHTADYSVVTGGAFSNLNAAVASGHVTRVTGNTQLQASAVKARQTLLVEGNLYITGNVSKIAGPYTAATLPVLGVVVTGNIYIDSSVNQLYGYYYAAGNIYTCATGAANPAAIQTNAAEAKACNKKLTVTGAMMAKSYQFSRTGDGTVNATGSVPSEIVNMTGDLYVSPPPGFADVFVVPQSQGERAPKVN